MPVFCSLGNLLFWSARRQLNAHAPGGARIICNYPVPTDRCVVFHTVLCLLLLLSAQLPARWVCACSALRRGARALCNMPLALHGNSLYAICV